MAGVGILLDLSDARKAAAKKRNTKRFVDTVPYRFMRCPNYLGELVIWTVVLLSGFGSVEMVSGRSGVCGHSVCDVQRRAQA